MEQYGWKQFSPEMGPAPAPIVRGNRIGIQLTHNTIKGCGLTLWIESDGFEESGKPWVDKISLELISEYAEAEWVNGAIDFELINTRAAELAARYMEEHTAWDKRFAEVK